MKETLLTISQRLGISVTTVSRVLSGNAKKYRISAKTVDIVKDEALRCNYTPSAVARSLRMKRTDTIGLILPSVSNKYFADIASVVIAECRERGYITIVMDVSESEEFQKNCIRSLVSRSVDGLIIAPCGVDCSKLESVAAEHFPVVLVDRYFEETSLSYATTNNYQGGMMAVRHLISAGHTRIACIQGVASSLPNTRRVAGYTSAMEEAGLHENIRVTGNDFSVQNGYVEMKLLLSSGEKPSAVFALSNTIALGVIKAVKESGMKIPDDISIISFDDNLYLDYMEPPITRIIQPVEDMAKLSVRMLMSAIDQENVASGSSHLQLSPKLVRRESVKDLKD